MKYLLFFCAISCVPFLVMSEEELQEKEIIYGDIPIPEAKSSFTLSIDPIKYKWEFFGVAVAIVYIINYFYGKNNNRNLARLWIYQNKDLFDQNFAHIGVSTSSESNDRAYLDQESPSMFKFWASGRINCAYALVSLELKKRHDLISMLILNLIWPEKDRIAFDIPITLQNDLPVCFAITRKRNAKAVLENFDDLKGLSSKYTPAGLSQNLTVLAEDQEIVDEILDDSIKTLLNKHEKNFLMIHVTDQKIYSNHSLTLRFSMNLPDNYSENPSQYAEMHKLAIHFIDVVAKIRMSSKVKDKCLNARSQLAQKKNKEEMEKKKKELEKKKQEKKKEDLKKMTPEAISKMEKREEKRANRRKQNMRFLKVQQRGTA